MLKEMEELEKRINAKTVPKPSKNIKEDMEQVVENAKQLYEMRNDIINTIKGIKKRSQILIGCTLQKMI